MLAILSDYNLSDPAESEAARQLLSALSSEVATEEATGFDPSGASRLNLLTNDLGSGRDDESGSAKSQHAWQSQTDDTSLSQELSALDLDGLDFSDNGGATSRDESPEKAPSSELDGLNEQGKEAALIAIFPALKPFDIKWTLRKCKGDAGLAIDELMTQSFLEESGSRHRGIEAFYNEELPSRQRKAKGKKRRGGKALDDAGFTAPVSPLQSKWDLGRQDVEFLATKTGMPIQQISSMYHKNGGSIRTTIAAITDAHASLNVESDDPMIQINASELHQDFPSISTSDLEILVQITHPSTNDARELAKALTSPPIDSKPSIQLEFRHAPVDLGSDSTPAATKSSNGVYAYREGSMSAAELASTHNQARDMAYIQAHAAFRKGKSDPLMGGAAAYYSQVGREHDAKAKIAESAAADALVSQQNSRSELDLHGLNVKDAVRISREKVTAWWHELSEQRKSTVGARRIGPEYQIITGKGNHSDGKGKLGSSVGKMLIREGWKVEVRGGRLLVMGVAKKR